MYNFDFLTNELDFWTKTIKSQHTNTFAGDADAADTSQFKLATPNYETSPGMLLEYEKESESQRVEQIIRPTGLIDPEIIIKPTKNQIDDLIEEIRIIIGKKERVLVTTLTKKMAEELSEYLSEIEIKVHYLHSEIQTIERVEILRDLRLGV